MYDICGLYVADTQLMITNGPMAQKTMVIYFFGFPKAWAVGKPSTYCGWLRSQLVDGHRAEKKYVIILYPLVGIIIFPMKRIQVAIHMCEFTKPTLI